VKAIGFPSPTGNTIGEIASIDYDARGNALGETALGSDGTRGLSYRVVNAMSERGQVTLSRRRSGGSLV
jgi:hypothetical protein